MYKIFQIRIQKADPIHPPSVDLPSFAKPTISQLKKDDGRTALYSKNHGNKKQRQSRFVNDKYAENKLLLPVCIITIFFGLISFQRRKVNSMILFRIEFKI